MSEPVVCNRADATICAGCPHAVEHEWEAKLHGLTMNCSEEHCGPTQQKVRCIPADREEQS